MTIQYNNPVGADYQGIDGIEKVTGSRSTGRLHFLPTGETRSPATPSHRSRSFPLLKKYSHHQGSNQIRIDRLQSPICRQSLFLLLLSIGYWALGLYPLAFLLGLFLPVSHKFPSLSHQRNHC
ncbi:hypothetical protein [Microcoleus sp. D2_18a_D3]|uniref:hypothetical protein n=1 Tax=Microcoleus sp. D2_18a_D3 TaxID=3055330 RepID=UPI003B1A565E